MHATGSSWRGMRALRTVLATYAVRVKLASEKEMKARLQLFSVPMTHTLVKLEASGVEKTGLKKGAKKTSEALVAVCSLLGIMARDLDASASAGTRVLRAFPCDRKVYGRRCCH